MTSNIHSMKNPDRKPDRMRQIYEYLKELYGLGQEALFDLLTAQKLDCVLDMNTLDPRQRMMLKLKYKLQEQWNTVLRDEIAMFCALEQKYGIKIVYFKGCLFAGDVFPKPEMRATGDIDMLVSHDDYMILSEVLDGLGYEHEKEIFTPFFKNDYEEDSEFVSLHETFFSDRGIRIELHPVFVDTYHEPYEYAKSVISNAKLLNIYGLNVYMPAPNDTVICLLNHFMSHFLNESLSFPLFEGIESSGPMVRNLLDTALYIDKYASEFTWQELCKRARSVGCFEKISTAIKVFAEVYPDMVPDDVLNDAKSADMSYPYILYNEICTELSPKEIIQKKFDGYMSKILSELPKPDFQAFPCLGIYDMKNIKIKRSAVYPPDSDTDRLHGKFPFSEIDIGYDNEHIYIEIASGSPLPEPPENSLKSIYYSIFLGRCIPNLSGCYIRRLQIRIVKEGVVEYANIDPAAGDVKVLSERDGWRTLIADRTADGFYGRIYAEFEAEKTGYRLRLAIPIRDICGEDDIKKTDMFLLPSGTVTYQDGSGNTCMQYIYFEHDPGNDWQDIRTFKRLHFN